MKALRFVLATAVFGLLACSGNQLYPAQIGNVVDTVTLAALHGGALATPSAYSVADGFPIRTDQTSGFDFVYDIDSLGRHVFLPLQVLGLGSSGGANPGLVKVTTTFDNTVSAPTNGYVADSATVIAVGDIYVVRSRITCSLGVPEYGKIEVLGFDDVARTVQLQALSDLNCGYRSLAAGVPTN